MDDALSVAMLERARREKARRTEGKPLGRTLWENIVGDDDPTTQNTGEKIGSWLNKAGESMTFGLIGDEASAAVESLIPGMTYGNRRDHYRQQEANLERDHPVASLAAEIGGGVIAPVGALGAVGKGAGILKRMGASGAATGALSGTYGFAEGEGGAGERLNQAQSDAKTGAIIGAAFPVVGGGVQRIANSIAGRRAIRQAARNAPSTAALRAQGEAAYKAVDDAGVSIRPEAFNRVRGEIAQALRGQGLDELPGPGSLTPKSARVMQIMGDMSEEMATEPTASLPLRSLDQVRRHAGTAAGDMTNKTESALGSEMIGRLDDFVQGLGPDDVDAGDVEALKTALPKARDLWSRMSRSQKIDDAIEASGDYLSGGSSGIRNQFRRILSNPKLRRGYSDAEKKVMRRVVNGTMPEQILHLISGGIGQLGMIGAGAGFGGPVGAMVGAGTAALARKGSERISNRNAEIARAIVANGGLPALPKAGDGPRLLIEQLLRQGTAAGQQ